MTHEEIQQLEQELVQKQEELREAKSAYQKAVLDDTYEKLLSLGWQQFGTAPTDGTVFLSWKRKTGKGLLESIALTWAVAEAHETNPLMAVRFYRNTDKEVVNGRERYVRQPFIAFDLWLPLPLPTSILASDLA